MPTKYVPARYQKLPRGAILFFFPFNTVVSPVSLERFILFTGRMKRKPKHHKRGVIHLVSEISDTQKGQRHVTQTMGNRNAVTLLPYHAAAVSIIGFFQVLAARRA